MSRGEAAHRKRDIGQKELQEEWKNVFRALQAWKVRESPRPHLGLVIHQKDSQNSLEAVTLMVMVYYSKKVQIKISLEQSPEEFHMWSFQLSSPSGVLDSTNLCQQCDM